MLGAGDTAPAFNLTDVHGRNKNLGDFIATKPALITVFKVSCPVCQYTAPFLERLSKSDNIEVIAISQDTLAATEAFREEYGITFPTLIDESKKGYPASSGFGISIVPSLFLVEPSGQITMSSEGFSKRDLEAVGRLAGVPPFLLGERIPDFKPG